MIVFLGFIVIFFALLLAPALKSARIKSQSGGCMSNLKQIGLASLLYARDHDGRFPESLFGLYPQYVSKTDIFFCPATPNARSLKKIKRPENANISYLLTPGLTERDDKNIILSRDKSMWNHYSSIYCCFVDGHVEYISLKEYIKKDFDAISSALQAFFKAKKRYPTNEEGLKILVNSGFLREILIDPFDPEGKRPYGYALDNTRNKWILTSYGPNKKPDINLNLYAQGKFSNQDLMKMQAQLIFGMMTIKRTNGDVFRVEP